MTRTPRKASSFPPSFQRIFIHVANTGEPVVINNLDNRRASYTTLRARLNEFRKRYHQEALVSGDGNRIDLAETMYAVTLKNPEKVNEKWQLEVCVKEFAYEEKINDILPQDALSIETIEITKPSEFESSGAKSIADLMAETETDK